MTVQYCSLTFLPLERFLPSTRNGAGQVFPLQVNGASQSEPRTDFSCETSGIRWRFWSHKHRTTGSLNNMSLQSASSQLNAKPQTDSNQLGLRHIQVHSFISVHFLLQHFHSAVPLWLGNWRSWFNRVTVNNLTKRLTLPSPLQIWVPLNLKQVFIYNTTVQYHTYVRFVHNVWLQLALFSKDVSKITFVSPVEKVEVSLERIFVFLSQALVMIYSSYLRH